MGATGDMFFKGQPERVSNTLTAPTTLMMFDETEGAEEHCHMGALKLYNQSVFEWLTDKLSVGTTK